MSKTTRRGINPEKHYVAMAELIIACSRLEYAVKVALQTFLKMDNASYGRLIGNPTIQKLLATFKFLVVAKKAPQEFVRELEYISKEATYLADCRNMYAHNPIQWTKTGFVINNFEVAKSADAEKDFRPTLNQTRTLAQYADLIRARFLSLNALRYPKRLSRKKIQGIGQSSRGTLDLPKHPGEPYRIRPEFLLEIRQLYASQLSE